MKFSVIVKAIDRILKTTKNIEKTYLIHRIIKDLEGIDLDYALRFFQGIVFLQNDERKIGISSKIIIKALKNTTGASEEKINKIWRETGDLGETGEKIMKTNKQSSLSSFTGKKETLTLEKVYNNLFKIAEIEGKGSIDLKI